MMDFYNLPFLILYGLGLVLKAKFSDLKVFVRYLTQISKRKFSYYGKPNGEK